MIFFLSIFTFLLYFFANFILSPEKNPRYDKLMEAADAPSQGTIDIIIGICNAATLMLAVGLVAVVPFFRVLAVIVMGGLVVRFFYRRYSGSWMPNFAWCDQDPRPTDTNQAGGSKASPLLTHMLDEGPDRVIEEPEGHGSPGAARGVPGYQPSDSGTGGKTSQ